MPSGETSLILSRGAAVDGAAAVAVPARARAAAAGGAGRDRRARRRRRADRRAARNGRSGRGSRRRTRAAVGAAVAARRQPQLGDRVVDRAPCCRCRRRPRWRRRWRWWSRPASLLSVLAAVHGDLARRFSLAGDIRRRRGRGRRSPTWSCSAASPALGVVRRVRSVHAGAGSRASTERLRQPAASRSRSAAPSPASRRHGRTRHVARAGRPDVRRPRTCAERDPR